MTEPRTTPGGLSTQYSSVGHYDLNDDQVMVVTVPVSEAPYQGIQLGSMWYISLDYTNHQTSLTADQARIDPDGRMRFVISASATRAWPTGSSAPATAAATCRSAGSAFGLPFGDAARGAVRQLHRERTTGAGAPAHNYSLADFGLSPTQVDERFAGHLGAHPRLAGGR